MSEPYSGIGSEQDWKAFTFDKIKGLFSVPCQSEADLAAPTAIGNPIFYAHNINSHSLFWHIGKIVSNDKVETKKKSIKIKNEVSTYGITDQLLDSCRDYQTGIAAFKLYRREVMKIDDLRVESKISDKHENEQAEVEVAKKVEVKVVQNVRKTNDTAAILRDAEIMKLKPWHTLGTEEEWNAFKLNKVYIYIYIRI